MSRFVPDVQKTSVANRNPSQLLTMPVTQMDKVELRGYPETLSFHRHKLMQHPCGNETQGDRKERVGSA
jgi:hypothetical protein